MHIEICSCLLCSSIPQKHTSTHCVTQMPWFHNRLVPTSYIRLTLRRTAVNDLKQPWLQNFRQAPFPGLTSTPFSVPFPWQLLLQRAHSLHHYVLLICKDCSMPTVKPTANTEANTLTVASSGLTAVILFWGCWPASINNSSFHYYPWAKSFRLHLSSQLQSVKTKSHMGFKLTSQANRQ